MQDELLHMIFLFKLINGKLPMLLGRFCCMHGFVIHLILHNDALPPSFRDCVHCLYKVSYDVVFS